MPRREPVTSRDIEKRRAFGFGPRGAISMREGTPAHCANNDQISSRRYNFDEALEILGLADASAERKRAGERELDSIVRAHRLALRVEDEETPARKVEALHSAIRLYPDLERALHRIADTRLSEKDIKQALEQYQRKNGRRLPLSLEHEVIRLQLSSGHSFADCCQELRDRYRLKSKPGHNKTDALRNTIHRLQAFASAIRAELTWTKREASEQRRAKAAGRSIPADLIGFLIAVLDAAGIKHPDYEKSPSKLRRLMVRPPQ
jgi:hypothetical protein